jgi:hypothetical protein
MRLAGWFRLIALGAIAGSVSAPCSPVLARPVTPGPKQPLIKEEFKGYGLTEQDARADALKTARDWLAEHSDLAWAPSPDYLRKKNMIHFGELTEEEFEKSGRIKVVTMQLEITADQAREIQMQARQKHMTSRHLLLARILAGLVCLLLVVGGYLRLEEATKGYYTRLLRLAAIGVLYILFSIGLGLYLLMG